jgi:hypothetical protein
MGKSWDHVGKSSKNGVVHEKKKMSINGGIHRENPWNCPINMIIDGNYYWKQQYRTI